jgi:hypothetical protein
MVLRDLEGRLARSWRLPVKVNDKDKIFWPLHIQPTEIELRVWQDFCN